MRNLNIFVTKGPWNNNIKKDGDNVGIFNSLLRAPWFMEVVEYLIPEGNTVPTREKIYKNALLKLLIGY